MPIVFWFACVAGAVAAGGLGVRGVVRGENRRAAAWAGVAVAAAAGAALLWPGKFYVEKSLTRLILPTGLLWLALLGLTAGLLARRRWSAAALAGVAAGLLTAAGNPVLAQTLAGGLEEGFGGDPLARGRFDAVAVLGGGVSRGPHDGPAVNAFGERVILAARLYHAGRTPRLLATGSSPPGDRGPGPGPLTRDLWERLAVPPGAIGTVPGTTTSEELARLTEAAAEAAARGEPWGRVGLVSSAWHLPRAMRLAGEAGLTEAPGVELVPLPADSLATLSTVGPRWIPDSESLNVTDRCLKEWLARLVRR